MTTDHGAHQTGEAGAEAQAAAGDVRTTLRELHARQLARGICKRRYGRATLTIRRYTTLGDLRGDLGEALEAYRNGKGNAEKVAWAFVRARITGHSATFSWEDAELAKLIPLVVECSKSPTLTRTEPGELADDLLTQRDADLERLNATMGQLAGAFQAPWLPSLVSSSGAIRALQRQQEQLAALSRSPFLNLSGAAARQMLGGFDPKQHVLPSLALDHAASGSLATSLFTSQIRLPEPVLQGLGKKLQNSLLSFPSEALSESIASLTRMPSFTFGQLVTAGHDVATLVRDEGAAAEAAELDAVTDTLVEVLQQPSAEALEAFASEMRARMSSLEEQLKSQGEEARTRERNGIVLALYFFYLSTVLAFFFWYFPPPH